MCIGPPWRWSNAQGSVDVLLGHRRDRAIGLVHHLVGPDQLAEVGRVLHVDRDQMTGHGAIGPIEGAGPGDDVGRGVVDPSMLGEMLLP